MTIKDSKPLLRFEDVHVTLGGNHILRGVTAELRRGRITALIGLNGSGKTTLLRALLGEIPYRGKIRYFCGHDHTRPSPQHIGYVPQKLQIDARLPLTVEDLLALALQRIPLFLGIARKTREAAREILRGVFDRDVEDLLRRPVESLSGGELQRVLMGLALYPHPELLLLDEPAAGIDFQDQEKFYDLIARLNVETGVTVLLVSHDVSMVRRQAHEVWCLKDGKIACQGPAAFLLDDEVLRKTFGESAAEFVHVHEHHS